MTRSPEEQRLFQEEILKEHTELVYKFLREHPDAALQWIDTNRDHKRVPDNPEIAPGDPAYGFWEIFSPTGYTSDEYRNPYLRGDDMTQLAYALMDREDRRA